MNEMSNEEKIGINLLSAIVSYPLFSELQRITGRHEALIVLFNELGTLLDCGDTQSAYLLFQFLMGISQMEIPAQVRLLGFSDAAVGQFMHEFYLDLEDYNLLPYEYGADWEEDEAL